MISAADRDAAVRSLLERAGVSASTQLEPLAGGANNRVCLVRAPERSLVLKSYFLHAADGWNRMRAEWEFVRFAWGAGLRALPEPVAEDSAHGLALYGYVDGRQLEPGEVDAGAVAQASAFFSALNRHREAARNLGNAAEACFSIAEHLRTIDRRLEELARIEAREPEDADARAFVRSALLPAWKEIRSGIMAAAGSDVDAALDPALRCVSPSDFGFHNAIRTPEGVLKFIDFEYAGWDDPAKLIADFFSQVALPVSPDLFDTFAGEVAAAAGDESGAIPARAALLLPAYTVKWCCILLNEFRPIGQQRREYADSGADTRKRDQLNKSHVLFKRL